MPKPPADTPFELLPYLTAKGSLTTLLEQKAGQALKVVVLDEHICTLDFAQKQALGLSLHRPHLAKIRTVLLYGNDDAPWVKATSIFPLSSLKGELGRLKSLRTTPIGYVLFKKNRTLPHTRQYYRHPDGFGRRTCYEYHHQPLLIDELFLPAFWQMQS